MRIISGKFKGRKILPPATLSLRPTTDSAKECLFNILASHFSFNEIRVLDLFTGTGCISFEFASRGCTDITAVDHNYHCIRFIENTIINLGTSLKDRFLDAPLGSGEVVPIQMDAFKYLDVCDKPFDIIFADPPYNHKDSSKIPELVFGNCLLNHGGWLILEHDKHNDFSSCENFSENRRSGNVNFSIFKG